MRRCAHLLLLQAGRDLSEHQEGKKHLCVPAGTRRVMGIDEKEVRGKSLLPTAGQLRYLWNSGFPESLSQTPDWQHWGCSENEL